MDSGSNVANDILQKYWLPQDSVQVGSLIATGAYGRVYAGTYGNLKVAIKDYGLMIERLDNDGLLDIMEEFHLMKDLNHTNTVRVYGFIIHQKCLALVLELAKGVLKDSIQNESLRKDVLLQYHILLQIALAMRFIHSEGILHRDLKPDNVLIFQDKTSSCIIKIADFGESRRINEIERSLTYGKGTFTYMDKAAVTKGNNKATDFYSFCALASEVLSGHFIPKITDLDSLMKRDNPTIPEIVPAKLRNCLLSGFDEDQTKRASWTDVIVALQSAMDMMENPTKHRRLFLQNLKKNFTDDDFIVQQPNRAEEQSSWRKLLSTKVAIVALLVCLLTGVAIATPLLILSQEDTIDDKQNTKLLVAAGFYGIPMRTTEIINLANPLFDCEMWAALPLGTPAQAAVGGFLGNGMIMCGGQKENDIFTEDCYLITSDNVRQIHSLSKPLMGPAGAIINNTLYVTGGFSKIDNTHINGTEFVSLEGSRPGPMLPINVADHCVIKIDNETLLLTGGSHVIGRDHVKLKSTWFFTLSNESWSKGPDMLEARWKHACGSLRLKDGSQVLVVAGDFFEGKNRLIDSVEILDLSPDFPEWTSGPISLPIDPSNSDVEVGLGHQIVSNDEYLYYINTYQNLFYQLECENVTACNWTKLETAKLKFPRTSAIVSLVPNEFVNC